MIDPSLSPDLRYRIDSISLIDLAWDKIRIPINEKIEKILPGIGDSVAENELKQSFKLLGDLIGDIINDKEYRKKEDPDSVEEYANNIEKIFKHLFTGLLMEMKWTGDDYNNLNSPINTLEKIYHDLHEDIRGKRIQWMYPTSMVLIRFLRNCQYHDYVLQRPIDPITGEKSWGNIFTLSSLIILSIYAYDEILRAWCETYKIS